MKTRRHRMRFLLWVAGFFITPIEAAESGVAWCEQQWLTQSAQYTEREKPDYRALQKSWAGYAGKCQGTVAYEARMALIYFFLDDPAQARAALKPVAAQSSEYDYLKDLVALLVEAKELILAKKTDESHLEDLDRKLLAYVNKYPKRAEGYTVLADLESELGRHDAAIKLYETALANATGDTQRWGVYRNLTIRYADAGRYRESYDSAGSALELKKDLMADPPFMYALARAEADQGEFEEAQATLTLIAAKMPAVRQDPDFLAAVDFVVERIDRSKQPAAK